MKYLLFVCIGVFSMGMLYSQDTQIDHKGHTNNSLYKELDDQLPTPNYYRTAAGAPGQGYYQQQADYTMNIILDDATQRLYGEETITYTNNSPDKLEYLWVQLDQNVRAPDSPSKLINQREEVAKISAKDFVKNYIDEPFQGGFQIEKVENTNGKALSYTIHQTMMRINLAEPLEPGKKFSFYIKWNYLINNYFEERGRSGYEYFPEEDNRLYVIAQFFPRMAVYSDVEGWQNMQFWGRSEFALPFGNYDVNITVPADFVINGTGKITNLQKNLTNTQWNRWKKAQKTYDKPVIIITEEEARKAEKKKSNTTKTWNFKAENVRDFGFSCSRKFIWDAMAVKINDKTAMAISLYPKEGNPLWEKYSTRAVAHTLKEYSQMTFDYPYHKAISVNAQYQGMEYPMICWNYGRCDADGNYSDATKYGMISVIIHEVGHNYFPMIVNSDERQWTWMDEGLNTFLQFVTEQNMGNSFPEEFNFTDKKYPSRRGFAKDIVDYMSLEQNKLMPIMTQGDHVYNFGPNAYGKPATALNILRTTIMGEDLFDYAFKTYSQRWMFKHPTPADFFRTMEDASGYDLDWFWRGWFYSTDVSDIGIADVKQFKAEYTEGENGTYIQMNEVPMGEISAFDYENIQEIQENMQQLQTTPNKLSQPRYFYQVVYEKPGGLIMPLLVTFEFEDGSSQEIRYPYMVWRLHEDRNIEKFYAFDKKITKITLDKGLETADIDTSNNVWPKENE